MANGKSLLSRLLALAVCFQFVHASDAITEPKLSDFADFANHELEGWHTPGASIAIVRGDELLLATGFGFRDLKEKKPMTAQTVQPVASISKSFTVASLAALVREGKLAWDKPVREYMPEFRLYDEYATAHITPRDLVTHATGLPRHDWVWVGSSASREDFVHRLRYLEPSAEPRTRYQYNNLAFCTAGYLAGRVAGSSWEELVRTKIFEPLGMANASFSVNDLAKNPDHATPYRISEKDEPLPIRYLNVDSLGPAGAINANAAEMSRYLRMLIGRGTFEGHEILSRSDVNEMSSQKMIVTDGETYKELGSAQYGMGLRITTYRGHKMVHHGGALRGLSASISFLPDQKIGVFVAVNASDSSIPSILTYGAYDRLLGLDKIDWSKRFRDRRDKDRAARNDARDLHFTNQKSGTQPSHPLEEFAGDYEHPGYGVFRFAVKDGALEGTFNGARAKFEHFHYDVFAAPKNEFSSFSEQKIQFQTSLDGDIDSVKIQLEPAVDPIIFKRKPDAKLVDPDFLKKLAGDYQIGAGRATAALRADNHLTWTSGGTTHELEPIRDARFNIADRPGSSVEFIPDESGAFSKVAVHTSSDSVAGKRTK
jgi:CubicO group peptidase (beta-lactamase class C family)